MRPSFFSWLLCVMLSFAAVVPASAQSGADLQIEVRVVNQGDNERNSAYWLAFDRVLRRHVETRVQVDPAQREALMKNPSLYVQTFRYRKYNGATDNGLLGTRKVREGAPPAAVISVTFPKDLAAIIQQQLIPVIEEEAQPVEAPVLAMVAVEQQDNQFIIGGERGKKFQARAMQLAAANNLQLEFPVIEPADLEFITAADILAGDEERINSFVNQRYQVDKVLSGALYRVSPGTWQSDWRYSSQGGTTQSFSLTTTTLDEALVSAMTQISPGGGYLNSAYSDAYSDGDDGIAGVPIRVENINSLADYDNVLAMLRRLDASIVTESLEPDAMVFRTSDQAAASVTESLIASRNFEVVSADQFAGDVIFRFQGR